MSYYWIYGVLVFLFVLSVYKYKDIDVLKVQLQDYINKISYDLQKENFAINQRNVNKQIAAERQRQEAARTGQPYRSDVVLEQPMSAENMGQSIYSGFSDFITEQYGGLLEGDQKSALYNNAFINMLNSMSNLGRYSQGG